MDYKCDATIGVAFGQLNKTFLGTSGLYYKTITIVIMTIVSDATIWSVTFDDAS